MASYACATSCHQTLTGTTVDTVTVGSTSDQWVKACITNRTGNDPLWVRADGTAAGVGTDGSFVVPAGSYKFIDVRGTPTRTISVLGNGNAYSVEKADPDVED